MCCSKGIVFNIQKFSIHDGPGIRTTVFLKGCPLRCRWCANPESQMLQKQLVYDRRKCLGCGACVNACPNGAVRLADGKPTLSVETCKSCFSCVGACAAKALHVEGSDYTVDGLMREILKDLPFYENSGGGVTLSGGEPLLQEKFVMALLKELRRQNIHTVLETCGHVRQEFFLAALPYADLLYFDLKHPDSEKHREKTGVSNELILANLKEALRAGKEVVARLPMIPGYNSDSGTAREYISLLRRLGVTKVHLLPFHQMGLGKYELMNWEYEYKDTPNMPKEELEPIRDLFVSAGIETQIGG